MNLVSLRRMLAIDSPFWVAPLILVLVLAVLMAYASPFNAHPDEMSHVAAADYYRTHWLPPNFGDAAAAPSYSKYGYSYLHERDLAYLLAGKWSALVAPLVDDVHFAYRLFNLVLLATVILVFARLPDARPFIAPLALSAQVWYVFSYFNSDAFALLAALFTAYQVSARGSAFNKALDAGRGAAWFKGIVLLGMGVGLLLLAKRNYYVFIAFLCAFVMLRESGFRSSLAVALGSMLGIAWYYRVPVAALDWLFGGVALLVTVPALLEIRQRLQDAVFRRRMGTFAAAGAVGLAIFLPRVAYDRLVVSDPVNQLTSVEAAAERFAADDFKPSRIAADSAMPGLHIRERGTSYFDMLFEGRHWLVLSFESLVGVYGYMSVFGPGGYYLLTAGIYLVLLAMLAVAVSGTPYAYARRVLAMAGFYAGLLVLVSSLHSWTSDFQAQGRYLFPAFVMLGMACTEARARLPGSTSAAAALAFVLALYSFCAVGLALVVV